MSADEGNLTFGNASQRVASTYQRMLSEFHPVLPEGYNESQQEDMLAAQAELHAFFRGLYDALSAAPDQFGLLLVEDIFLVQDHPKEGPTKSDVKRVLDRQRKVVEGGLAFLSAVGLQGWLEGNMLVVASDAPALKFLKKKSGRGWMSGLEMIGLARTQAGDQIALFNQHFPGMMPALKLLAESCAQCEDAEKGRIFFSRCDFRAIRRDFEIVAMDLFRIFPAEDAAWASELHTFFTNRGYRHQVGINRMFSWTVKYQGKRSIKATPLFQLEFDERFQRQMRAGIKCASAQRIGPLLPDQSQALQDDFMRRANSCGDCHWCDNQKTLGPSVVIYRGEERKVCWYVNPDIEEYTSETADLVQEYALMHEGLG